MRELERVVLLNITDTKWREHLYEMDYLQEGIHLRALAQKDPITEYRREAYDMFQDLTASIQADFVRYIYRVEFVNKEASGAAAQADAGQPGRGRAGGRCRRSHRDGQREPGGQRQDAAQRPVPVRQRQEVQEVPRRRRLRPASGSENLAGTLWPQMSESTEPLRKLRERVLAAKEFL